MRTWRPRPCRDRTFVDDAGDIAPTIDDAFALFGIMTARAASICGIGRTGNREPAGKQNRHEKLSHVLPP